MLTVVYVVLSLFITASNVSAAPAFGKDRFRWPAQEKARDAVRLLYQYPVGTWIENIAVRKNGELLLTLLNAPHLDRLDPLVPESTPETVCIFPDAASVAGIAEIDEDIFALSVGTFDLSNGPVAGSWSIWNVAFQKSTDSSAMANKIIDLPDFIFPDGVAALPSGKMPMNIFTADFNRDGIWRVDSTTGEINLVIDNDLTKVVPDAIFGMAGVNGLKVRDESLYFVNTGLGTFAKVDIDADGTPTAEPEIISRVQNSSLQYDDFALKDDAAYLVTGSGNSVERINSKDTDDREIIAGNLNSAEIAEPTAAAFGRTEEDKHILYVVTAGGLATPVNGGMRVGAQVLAIDTSRFDTSIFGSRNKSSRAH